MKSLDIKSVSNDELLQRVAAQPEGNIWLTIVVSLSDFDKAIDELRETLNIFIECDIRSYFW